MATTGFTQRWKGKIGTAFGNFYQDGNQAFLVYTNAGAPTNGTSGTLAKIAPPSSLLADTTNLKLYQNTNTKASPTWTIFEAAGGTLTLSNADALSALAGGAKASATPITTQVARFSTVTTNGDSALLPAATAGGLCILENDTAQWMKVYGAGTDTINNVATATATIIPAKSVLLFAAPVAGKWYVNLAAVTPAVAQSSPSAPTAPSSTSTYAMQGLAGAITPLRSGTVLVTVSGYAIGSSTTANDGILLQLSYGTGAAPSNAGALAGTQVGTIMEYTNPVTVVAADIHAPFSTQAVITGLTPGTAYWLDLAAKSVSTNSTVGIAGVNVTAVEIG